MCTIGAVNVCEASLRNSQRVNKVNLHDLKQTLIGFGIGTDRELMSSSLRTYVCASTLPFRSQIETSPGIVHIQIEGSACLTDFEPTYCHASPHDNHYGRLRPSHDATARTSEQPTHHTRTNTAHGRVSPTRQSPPIPAPSTTTLNTLSNCLPSPSRRTKATSTHSSATHKPRRPRPTQQQWPLVLPRHGHQTCAQVREIRRV
jgi:hypothetical protein